MHPNKQTLFAGDVKMEFKVDATNDNWGDNPYKPPKEEDIRVIPAKRSRFIHLICIFTFIAFICAAVGVLTNSLGSLFAGLLFSALAALLAFFEWI